MAGLPEALRASLVDGPSLVTTVEWHDRCTSTNARALTAAADGAAEGLLVVTDEQMAGRGRHGRTWIAPPGSSLLFSLLLRPRVPADRLGLLPLLAGGVLVDTVARHLPEHVVATKWPNDLLVDARKAAGILAEAAAGAVVVGIGVNVDWRGVMRPAELQHSTSLAEAADRQIDRWRLLAGFLGVFTRWYDQWQSSPSAFLPSYRTTSATLGRRVTVERTAEPPLEGDAVDIDASGALVLQTAQGQRRPVTAGDVRHLRPV